MIINKTRVNQLLKLANSGSFNVVMILALPSFPCLL